MTPRFCPYCRVPLERGVQVAVDLSHVRCESCKKEIDMPFTIITAQLQKGFAYILLLGIEAYQTAAYTGQNPRE